MSIAESAKAAASTLASGPRPPAKVPSQATPATQPARAAARTAKAAAVGTATDPMASANAVQAAGKKNRSMTRKAIEARLAAVRKKEEELAAELAAVAKREDERNRENSRKLESRWKHEIGGLAAAAGLYNDEVPGTGYDRGAIFGALLDLSARVKANDPSIASLKRRGDEELAKREAARKARRAEKSLASAN